VKGIKIRKKDEFVSSDNMILYLEKIFKSTKNVRTGKFIKVQDKTSTHKNP
jgi:hypothetical protein